LNELNLEGTIAHYLFAEYYFAAVALCWQANCIKAQAKEKKSSKNAREGVKTVEGGITAKIFRKV
jgi:hypothetical protein